MLIQAAVDGMGAALGHSLMTARELGQGALVFQLDSRVTALARYLPVTAPASKVVGSANPNVAREAFTWRSTDRSMRLGRRTERRPLPSLCRSRRGPPSAAA